MQSLIVMQHFLWIWYKKFIPTFLVPKKQLFVQQGSYFLWLHGKCQCYDLCWMWHALPKKLMPYSCPWNVVKPFKVCNRCNGCNLWMMWMVEVFEVSKKVSKNPPVPLAVSPLSLPKLQNLKNRDVDDIEINLGLRKSIQFERSLQRASKNRPRSESDTKESIVPFEKRTLQQLLDMMMSLQESLRLNFRSRISKWKMAKMIQMPSDLTRIRGIKIPMSHEKFPDAASRVLTTDSLTCSDTAWQANAPGWEKSYL